LDPQDLKPFFIEFAMQHISSFTSAVSLSRTSLIALFWLIAASLIAGCSGRDPNLPEVARVKGIVMFEGKPLPEGEVHFVPEDPQANPASGMINEDGTFELSTYERYDGATVGKHKVTINIPPHLDGSIPDPPIQLPKRYGNPDETPLSVEVESRKTNEFELTIEK
jgi:hypothetical protein